MLPETVHNPAKPRARLDAGKERDLRARGRGVAPRARFGSRAEMHMIPTGKPEPSGPRVGLYLHRRAADEVSLDFKLGSKTIDTPGWRRQLFDRRRALTFAGGTSICSASIRMRTISRRR